MIRGITFDQQLIKAEDMAHFMRTYSASTAGITRGCEITSDESNIYIAEGYMLIQGREIKITGTHEIPFESVTSGEEYCRVVLEIDLSKSNTEDVCNQLDMKTIMNSSGYPELTQQDLEDEPTGIYQYLIAQYHVNVEGVDSFEIKAGAAEMPGTVVDERERAMAAESALQKDVDALETSLTKAITDEAERAAKAETETAAATTRETINRILLSGFEDGTKVFSDDGTVITSTASDGRTLTKTFTDSFTVMTVVLASAEGTEIARMVKTFSTDGKTISVTVTYAEG